MHPDIRREKPGMCPECGMALIPVKVRKAKNAPKNAPVDMSGDSNGSTPVHHLGCCHGEQNTFDKNDKSDSDKHAGHRTASFLTKFWVSLVLTIPILAYSELAERFFGWRAPQFDGAEYVSLILASIIFFYCGWIFLASAWRELRARLPGMMTLIALAITTAYVWSVYSTLTNIGHNLWWELSTLIAIMLLGHWIEMRAVQGAQGALKELAKLLPDTAEVIRNGQPVKISLNELKIGDVVLVRPGAKIPADGRIIEGRSDLNESIITGESRPIEKTIGGEVIAGSINGDGSLKVVVTKIGENTFLAGVMRLVADAQASKSRLQMLSDRAAFYLTIVAVVSGVVTLIAWLIAGATASTAIERLVAVLVIACPHALGLAIPLVASISTTMAARNGLLVKHRSALEIARKIDVVLFDKTGTLTKGEFGVTEIIFANGRVEGGRAENGQNKSQEAEISPAENEILKLAAAVNGHSEHPIGKAIVATARTKNISFPDAEQFERIAGKGARGVVNGIKTFVGNEALAADLNISFSEAYSAKVGELSRQGKTVVHVISGGSLGTSLGDSTGASSNYALVGGIALADIIREESREAINSLKKLGVKVAMITGDSQDVADWVSKELGLDEYFAKVLPGQKSEKVKEMQAKGYKVAMVGDGVNDAPALTQADLGIAIGAGTNVAIESAGIILVKNDPRDIPKIVSLSKLTYSKMIQNIFWATGYNLIALPIAAGVLAPWGVILQPAVAAVFMSLSTVIVSVNAVFLRRRTL